MYESYYKLRENPFRLVPDPKFFYQSSGHKRALSYLQYGLSQGEGFVVITGAPGTGKTTLAQRLLEEISVSDLVVAHITTTQIDAEDMLRLVAASFNLQHENIPKSILLKNIENFLHARNSEAKRCILVVDEAQNLPLSSLEELRMLSNYHVGNRALLQSFLLGQEQFQHMLEGVELEQLRQRVIAHYHLNPLTRQETAEYIESRLIQVGWCGDPQFTSEAIKGIHRYTEGIPRRINMFCDRLMLFGFVDEVHKFSIDVVQAAISELTNETVNRRSQLAQESQELNLEQLKIMVNDEVNEVEQDRRVSQLAYVNSRRSQEIDSGNIIGFNKKQDSLKDVVKIESSSKVAQLPVQKPGNNSTQISTKSNEIERISSEQKSVPLSLVNANRNKPILPVETVTTVLDFKNNPLQFSELTDLNTPLPEGIDAILELATAHDNEIIKALPVELEHVSPNQLKDSARYFIRQVLFQPGANYYRILGLDQDASVVTIQKHYRLLVRLFYSDRRDHPKEWETDFALRLNKAHTTLRNLEKRMLYDKGLESVIDIDLNGDVVSDDLDLEVRDDVSNDHVKSFKQDANAVNQSQFELAPVKFSSLEQDAAESIQAKHTKRDKLFLSDGGSAAVSLPKLLVVEDLKNRNYDLFNELAKNYWCLEARDGEEAWKLLQSYNDIEVVITDIEVPLLSGTGLIRRIRASKISRIKEIPIIVITKLDDSETKQKALQEGANEFINKSIDKIELLARVTTLSKLSQNIRRLNFGDIPLSSKGIFHKYPRYSFNALVDFIRSTHASSWMKLGIVGFTILTVIILFAPTNNKKYEGNVPESIANNIPAENSLIQDESLEASPTVTPSIISLSELDDSDETQTKDSIEQVVIKKEEPKIKNTPVVGDVNEDEKPESEFKSYKFSLDTPENKDATKSPERTSVLVSNPMKDLNKKDDVNKPELILPLSVLAEKGNKVTSKTEFVKDDDKSKLIASTDTIAMKEQQPIKVILSNGQNESVKRLNSNSARVNQDPVDTDPNSTTSVIANLDPFVVDDTKVSKAIVQNNITPLQNKKEESDLSSDSRDSSTQSENIDRDVEFSVSQMKDNSVIPLKQIIKKDQPVTIIAQTSSETLDSSKTTPQRPAGKIITQRDLAILVFKFIRAYEQGKIDRFMDLFEESARTEDRLGKSEIKVDYESLFKSTDVRQFNLGEIDWDIKFNAAKGKGRFEAKIKNTAKNSILKSYSGEISFYIDKVGDDLLISQLYFSYNK